MFYKFNQITQSLGNAFQDSSMGKSLGKKATVEPLNIHYEYATHQPNVAGATLTQQQGATQIKSVYPNTAKYKNLMEMQTKFLASDGKLVWQKLPKDLPLYYTSVFLVAVGFGLTLYSIAKLAQPPQNEEE